MTNNPPFDHGTKHLYHYTSAPGLLGIIQNSAVWATDTRFLNDEQELRVYREDLLELLRVALTGLPLSTDFLELEKQSTLKFAIETIENYDAYENPHKKSVHVACFCEDGDLLSQWRSYGKAGGYAIAFRPRALIERDLNTGPTGKAAPFDKIYPSPARQPVLYHADKIKELSDEALDTVLSGVKLAESFLRGPWNALLLLALVKHESFSEEREHRVVYVYDAELEGNPLLKFRPHQSLGIAPYIEIPFSPGRAIRGIVVGPGPDRSARMTAVRRLLDSHGLAVPVWTSSTPYRE